MPSRKTKNARRWIIRDGPLYGNSGPDSAIGVLNVAAKARKAGDLAFARESIAKARTMPKIPFPRVPAPGYRKTRFDPWFRTVKKKR